MQKRFVISQVVCNCTLAKNVARFSSPPLGLLIVVVLISALSATASARELSSFNEIKSAVFATPYEALPQYKVTKKKFGAKGDRENNHLLAAARRTLSSTADLLEFPHGQKLFNANGICFAGVWSIDSPSPYTGQFSTGTHSLVIARASVALSGTKQRDRRAFGFALKLFPGINEEQASATKNVFVMHSLGGTRAKHVLNLALDNEPSLGSIPSLGKLGTVLRMQSDLERADAEAGANPPQAAFRPISALAVDDASPSTVLPRWLRLVASEEMPRVDENDFRDELRVENYPNNTLIYRIDVASNQPPNGVDGKETGKKISKKKADWQTIGELRLNESITSPACDQTLHFAHPTNASDQ